MKRIIHFLVHTIASLTGLLVVYFLTDQLSFWDGLFFLSLTFLPFIDESLYAAIRYADNPVARAVTNLFFTSSTGEYLIALHEKRRWFKERFFHNLPVYLGLWTLWFAAYIYDAHLLFLMLSSLITHLITDIINDYYEFGSIRSWSWPLIYANQLSRSLIKD